MITEHGRKALIKVAEWLEAGAPHLDINGRELDKFDMQESVNRDDCGTACCIAGAVVQFEGLGELDYDGSMSWFGNDDIDYSRGVSSLAQDFIGLSEEEAYHLFAPFNEDHFIDNLRSDFNNHLVAAAVIRAGLAEGHFKNAWNPFVGAAGDEDDYEH